MFWDCGSCGQTELLGLTHRHCPTCGSPQDPEKRYFPTEDKKVAVHEHRFVGRDRECAYCQEANSAAAEHCGRCGAPLQDGSEAVAVQTSSAPNQGFQSASNQGFKSAQSAMLQATEAPKKKKSRAGLFVGLGILAVVVIGIAFTLFWKETGSVAVTGHQWERSVEIQSMQTVNRGTWCDSLPRGAFSIRREQRQRSTRRVQDGETCSNVNVDNGDGTFRQEQRCEPRYRQEAVYDTYCTYQINDWNHQTWVHARGASTAPPPSWPAFSVTGCQSLGCTRQGRTIERNVVMFQREGNGEAHECDFDLARWQSFSVGQQAEAQFRVIGGGLDCESLGGSGAAVETPTAGNGEATGSSAPPPPSLSPGGK